MMGVPPAAPFLAWVLENVAVVTLSSAALATVLKASGVFAHSDAFVVFLFLLDFGVSAVMLSYFLSALFSQANTAALWTSLVYLVSFLPYVLLLVLHNQLSAAAQTLLVSGSFRKTAEGGCHPPNKTPALTSRCHFPSPWAFRYLPAFTGAAGRPRRVALARQGWRGAGVAGGSPFSTGAVTGRGSLGRREHPKGKERLPPRFMDTNGPPKLRWGGK